MLRYIGLAITTGVLHFTALQGAAAGADLKWSDVQHFGVSLAMPTYLEEAEGRVMYYPDGSIQMETFESETPDRYLRFYSLKDGGSPLAALQQEWAGGKISYSLDTKTIGVLSGTSGADRIFYGKCLGGGQTLTCFDISYPASEKAAMDPVISRMSGSFK